MAVVLFDDGVHKCVAFTDLVAGEGVQANQFAISHQGEGVLLDPGGNLTYKHLLAEISDYFLPSKTRYIFASHPDPDIIASVNGWLLITDAQVLIAQEWERFLPHFLFKRGNGWAFKDHTAARHVFGFEWREVTDYSCPFSAPCWQFSHLRPHQ